MSNFVRVALENGTEASVSAAYAEAAGLTVIGESDLPQDATRTGGRPLLPKTTVAELAAAKQADSAADTTEE